MTRHLTRRVLVGVVAVAASVAVAILLRLTFLERNESTEVYRAVFVNFDAPAPINVDRTVSNAAPDLEAMKDCAPSMLATAMLTQWMRPRPISQHDYDTDLAHVVDGAEQTREVEAADVMGRSQTAAELEGALDNAFNTALVRVSRVAFDLSGRHALVDFKFRCGGLCGFESTILLRRVGREWKVSPKECGPQVMY